MRTRALLFCLLIFSGYQSFAGVFGNIKGLVHDQQHRPIQGAQVEVRARNSDWVQRVTTNDEGSFLLTSVPVGQYTISVNANGFAPQQLQVTVTSGNTLDLHFPMSLPKVTETVEVSAAPEEIDPGSSTTENVISRDTIAHTPGAARANSMAMITNYVPGAYVVHDQLHVRGGHQVSWLLDGVPVPNTNIASNVGPQFDPKDVDYVEAQRGGYSAENGDRTYGVFNVVTRSGFERHNQAELLTSYGSFNQTDNQINFGSHSERFAYYGSVSGNRTDLGLETPVPETIHDNSGGLSGFTSLIFNASPSDQFRLVSAVRGDHFQVPNDPDLQAAGIRDVQDERDAFVNFSWIRTLNQHTVLTVSPFYHFNRAHFIGGPGDTPVIPEDDRGSTYAGGVVSLDVIQGRHNARFGFQGFGQRDNQLINVVATDGTGDVFRARQTPAGSLLSFFVEDQFRMTSWLTVNGGLRLTHFAGGLNENAADPRIGAAIQIPHLKWVLRGFYGRYYQAPPLLTVSGPVLELAANQGLGFLPLKGERDEQHEFGIAIPLAGWALELNHFRTGARNFFDHDVLGNSSIFFPLTIQSARIRGWEANLHSPEIARTLKLHLAYSRQYVEGKGGVSGGLTDFEPPADNSYFFLDHDQRDTLSTGFDANLPWKTWAAGNLNYGSGFLDGDGPAHLPSHTTFDLSLGRSFGENVSVQASAINISNSRYLLDNSNTFGGTHFNEPRQFIVQLRYRFHY